MVSIKYTKEFEDWFSGQDEGAKILVHAKVMVLKEFGHNLGRPHADTIKGSRYKNLKELRIKHRKYVLRILFIFDVNRNCWLLIGGSKKGKNEGDFYGKLIKRAEGLIVKYPQIQEGKDG